jgi:hypothetical protein
MISNYPSFRNHNDGSICNQNLGMTNFTFWSCANEH